MTTNPVHNTTDDLIAEIEAADIKTTDDIWTTDGHSMVVAWSDQANHGYAVAKCEGPDRMANAPYIAACSPSNIRALIARIREIEKAQRWIPCSERLPESEAVVMACYRNVLGKWRSIRAEYVAKFSRNTDDGWDHDCPCDYDEETDQSYWPAGWYERIDNWDELTHIAVIEGDVSHWKPMQEPPQ